MHKVILSCQSVDEPLNENENENFYVPHKVVLTFLTGADNHQDQFLHNVLSENSERQANILVEHI